jgi:hypothetical protein
MRINYKFIQIIVLCMITTASIAALPRNDDGAIITSLAPLG